MDHIDKLKEISKEIENEIRPLNSTQLNWKQNSESWSIAQCLQHIIVSNEQYLPLLQNLISGKSKMTFWEKINPLTSYTGKMMIKTLGPVITKKFQSPKLFLPSFSEIKVKVVDDFIDHQNKLIKIYTSLNDPKFKKSILTSPVAALLTLKVEDILTILVVHEERHLQQIIRLKTTLLSNKA